MLQIQSVTRFAMLAGIVAFAVHILFGGGMGSNWGKPQRGKVFTADPSTLEDDTYPQDPNTTIWQLMLRDPTLAGYVNLNKPFDDIVGHLDNESEIYTVYAPTNAAFEGLLRHPVAAPDFYWKFLSLNHMGPHNVSHEDVLASTTVENFINHDVYFKNLQRLSTKDMSGDVVFNHVAKYVGRPLQAINGFVHHIDSLLYLPDAVSDLLRQSPDLQTFRQGLIDTAVAVRVNDTQQHLTQTVFAPSDEAFRKLGSNINEFLFGPWGRPFLAALMEYHVVMNRTLFTDVYFLPNNSGQVPMNTSNATLSLPTLLAGRNLSAAIIDNGLRQTIKLNDEVVVTQPDLVMMDGVVHKIDVVLFPPLAEESTRKTATHSFIVRLFFAAWKWATRGSEMDVEEVMERLQPLMADAGTVAE